MIPKDSKMQRHFFLFTILPLVTILFLPRFSNCQPIRFQRQMRISQLLFEKGISIVEIPSGFLLAGQSGACSNGTCDESMALIRVNDAGDILWAKRYGSATVNYSPADVAIANDGGYIFAGNTDHGATSQQGLLIRTDTTGNTIWQICFGTPEDDYPRSVHSIGSDFYVTGYSQNSGGNPGPTWKGFLAKVDSAGSLKWMKVFTNTSGYSVYFGRSVTNANGNIVIASGIEDFPADLPIGLVKSDTAGNILTQNFFEMSGSPVYPICEDVMEASDGSFYVTARGNNNYSFVVTRFLPDHSLDWTRRIYALPSMYYKVAVAETWDQNGVWLSGGVGTSLNSSAWILLDSNGSLQTSLSFDSPAEDQVQDMIRANECQYAMLGHTKESGPYKWWLSLTDADADPGCLSGNFSPSVVQVTSAFDTLQVAEDSISISTHLPNMITETATIIENDTICFGTMSACQPVSVPGRLHTGKFNGYPNPSAGFVTIGIPPGSDEISLTNTAGLELFRIRIPYGSDSYTLSLSEMRIAAGICILEIHSPRSRLRQRIVYLPGTD